MQCDTSYYRSPFEMNAELIQINGQLITLHVISVCHEKFSVFSIRLWKMNAFFSLKTFVTCLM